MAGLPEVIGLLYRADWTRLSRRPSCGSEADREPLPRLSREGRSRAWPGQRQDNGRYLGRGALLIGPGGRWRLEGSVPGRGAGGEAAEGNDGERGWSWRPSAMGGPPPLPVEVNGAYPPVPELFCPSCLLGGYTLEELGPVTVAGRDAIAVAATPRRDVLGSDPGDRPYDRVEVAVDAELGILLRRIETSGGEFVTRTELTDVTMNPLEAADPARFAPPLGSHRGETPGEHRGETFSGPGGAADRAAGGLGALIRHVPHRPGHGAAGEQPEAMPSPDPAPLEPADGSPPPDEVLDLLYRSGEPRDLGATARQWHDPGRHGGMDARKIPRRRARRPRRPPRRDDPRNDREPHGRPAARQRPRPVPPRLFFAPPRPQSLDDDRLRRRAPLAGPPGLDPGWSGRPAGEPHRVPGRRVLAAPRPAVRRHGTHLPRPSRPPAPRDPRPRRRGTIPEAAADVLPRRRDRRRRDRLPAPPDLLRRRRARGLGELDDISTEPADPDEFRVHVPPGTRTVEETGNLIANAVAVMPGVTGTAARAAAEAVNRTAGAVSAARSFLDDLRGHR